jgi:hypothetical protein
MTRRNQHPRLELPWSVEQADRHERQSEHVINTTDRAQSRPAMSSGAGPRSGQQATVSQNEQPIKPLLITNALRRAHQLEPNRQPQEPWQEHSDRNQSLHREGKHARLCSELIPEALLSLNSTQEVVSSTPLLDLGLTFRLSSNPSASKIIYLDFNGHTTSGTSWNNSTMGSSFYSPAYDIDGNTAGFSETELTRIQTVWQRVASDFAPFDVNVTTLAPPADWLTRSGSTDPNYGVRVVVTSYGPSSSFAAGTAFLGSFTSSVDTPVFIYNTSILSVAEATSHEVGHSMGLSHDGNRITGSTYYTGHDTGETSWAPIMGGAYNRSVTTWDDGTYTGSNNSGSTGNYGKGGDDLAVIVGTNGFGYRADLVGNVAASATALSLNGGAVAQYGTIETRSDTDWYSFQLLAAGDLDLSFDPYWYRAYVDADGAWGGDTSAYLAPARDTLSTTPYPENTSNLDLAVELYDSKGSLLMRADEPGLRTHLVMQGLSAATYYLKLDGVGLGDPTASTPTGYTDYASIGDYWISGTITSAVTPSPNPLITLALAPGSVSEDGSSNLVFTFTRSLVTADPLSVNFTVSGTASNGSDYTGLLAGSSQSVTFAANAATASVVINPTADTTVEANETVGLEMALGTGYTIGTPDAITGTISNDDFAPKPLVFTTQADILTGTTGADNFVLSRHSDALWSSAPDRITNLQAGVDTVDSPFRRTNAIYAKQLGLVPSLDAAGIEGLLTSRNLVKNGAATFTFGAGSELRTFLTINDDTAGFKSGSDSVIEITGYTGSLSSLAIF